MQQTYLFDLPSSTPINAVDAPLEPLDPAEVSAKDCLRLWNAVLHGSIQAAMVGSPASSSVAIDRLRDISHARIDLLAFARQPNRQDCHLGFVVDLTGLDRDTVAAGIIRLYRRNWAADSHSLALKQQSAELYRYVAADGRSFFCPKPQRYMSMSEFMRAYPEPGEPQRW
ncbi:hypothetical protein RGQ15_10365 [Paracoccus sp. MBLB3053]|uniref:Uncharacterized protein n=1 Tax=Paracoccus aurantius TaxID=3073814 RepID=A0ABU2HSI3_9RHOB|nr:hypothetical protein [Paracoccus sp. MBLB3053]MDS9467968.1 hypothetical protein [Paracoccus sp. MBLB3053]